MFVAYLLCTSPLKVLESNEKGKHKQIIPMQYDTFGCISFHIYYGTDFAELEKEALNLVGKERKP